MEFRDEVSEKLGCYVYRLIDPRNGETFYVGRGRGNRVFAHVRNELGEDSAEDTEGMPLKRARIRSILNDLGQGSVLHVIHRHGLDEKGARLVEAALIDAYPGLTNEVGGEGSADFGPAHAQQLIDRYGLPAFDVDPEHRLLLITINRSFSASDRSVLDSTRAAWRINRSRAERAHAVLAVAFGVVKGVYRARGEWLPATQENFPFLSEDFPQRWGFEGEDAPLEFQNRYLSKRVPAELLNRPGARGPLRYNYD